ncbi:hypothetical protein O181_017691 [Austropuccinia psidii MF-1]|uniref:Retrotransposon gag domain-containing protein n=1 Tax=Austropuccinia psidii MF-1 TaxID=1389203 RepID=A0A9Q3C3V5_9BASI|nr:hypothetical protein [Austropuccinia psidii MF-1]
MSEGARERLGEVEDEEEDCGNTAGADVLANAPESPQDDGANDSIHGATHSSSYPRDNSKAPAFKTLSMKAPDSCDGTQAHKLRGFIQSCQLIFHNDPENLFSDRKKALYSNSFLTGRAGKWIEPCLSNISIEDASYLLSNWKLFETQLFTLFGDSNEFRKADQELDNLRMKESGHVSLYIADFRSLISRVGDWGERAYSCLQKRIGIKIIGSVGFSPWNL